MIAEYQVGDGRDDTLHPDTSRILGPALPSESGQKLINKLNEARLYFVVENPSAKVQIILR